MVKQFGRLRGRRMCAKIALSQKMERCNQRLTETHVSTITHYGIGHFQARNVTRNTFLAGFSP